MTRIFTDDSPPPLGPAPARISRRYAMGETKVHISMFRICLIACCVCSSSLSFAQNPTGQVPTLPEQTVESQNGVLIESTDSGDSAPTSGVQDAVPTSDPQDIASGSASPSGGTASPSGTASP